jgi:hypothetical protein
MPYISPDDVLSPKARLQLVKVLIDRGPEDAAYALANWDGSPCIVFRWNGSNEQPIGNPQSRGLPTWVVLDNQLNVSIIDLLLKRQPNLQAFARTFLGL